MPSKSKPLTEKARVVSSPVIEARKNTGLSQAQFAALMGVSVRTLQGWEQGRKQPRGAARTLLAIAYTNPMAVLAVAGKLTCPLVAVPVEWK